MAQEGEAEGAEPDRGGSAPGGREAALGTAPQRRAEERKPRNASEAARLRVERALADLGPGLADVALCCCCLTEGLELFERRMGWSARSGKVVLRIALGRLHQHYRAEAERTGMIG